MKRWVDFTYGYGEEHPMRGYEGGPLPVDKLAELVLSWTCFTPLDITVAFDDGHRITYVPVATSETHVGACGHTTLI